VDRLVKGEKYTPSRMHWRSGTTSSRRARAVFVRSWPTGADYSRGTWRADEKSWRRYSWTRYGSRRKRTSAAGAIGSPGGSRLIGQQIARPLERDVNRPNLTW